MATIEEVYRELNFPSIRKLTIALRSRQIPFTTAAFDNLTRTNEVNQIYGPPPKYEGKITASRMHERWQVDLADMTSKPGKDGSDHILFVMDIFSREVWARSIKGATAEVVTSAFESILREAGAKPVEVNSDGGPEFTNAFSRMLQLNGINQRRKPTPDSRNDLATLDSAMGNIKLALEKEITASQVNIISTVLDKVIKGYNATPHSHLSDEAPKDVEKDLRLRFELRQQAVKDKVHNAKVNTKIQDKLTEQGAFRTLVPNSQFKRRDQPRYDNKVHNVASQIGNVTKDSDGNFYLSKLLLAVPAQSRTVETMQFARGGSARVQTAKRQALQPFANALIGKLQERNNISTADASKFLRTQPGFNEAIRRVTTFGEFIRLFPEVFTLVLGGATGGASRVRLTQTRRRITGKQPNPNLVS